MSVAIEQARKAQCAAEIPVGAVIVLNNQLIACGYNRSIQDHDPSAHAEIVAIRQAAQSIGNYRLINCSLYVTLEPCLMCAGAIIHARIEQLIYGASDRKSGVINSQQKTLSQTGINHRPLVRSGVLATECQALLTTFFDQRRAAGRVAT